MRSVNAKEAPVRVASARAPATALPNLAAGDGAPLYERVKRHMSEAILVGDWPPGAALPNETELARGFGVAVGTVRRAMTDLVAEGLLSRRRKTGTVVTGRAPHHSLRFFFQYFRLHRADGGLARSTSRFLSVALSPASEEEAAALQLRGSDVITIHRVRDVDGRPVMHDRLTLARERFADWPLDPARLPPLLYLHLLERYGVRISAVRERIAADLAGPDDARLLDIAAGDAVLTIEEVAYDQAGTPTILGRHRATTRGHVYVNEVR